MIFFYLAFLPLLITKILTVWQGWFVDVVVPWLLLLGSTMVPLLDG